MRTATPRDPEPATWRDLVQVSDAEPGIRRRGGKRPRYVDERSGSAVRDRRTLERIASLAVPPAWTGVWICCSPAGHLQATGRDARGRKQYRYHPLFRAKREADKFADLVPFGEALGPLRARLDADLQSSGLPEERVLALVLVLLDRTRMRIGNEGYVQENGTFGLTTLRDEHVELGRGALCFRFVGKAGRDHEVRLCDPQLARLVRRCRDLPGQVLFQWEDEDGTVRPLGSGRVNEHLRAVTGLDVTAKTFRTWGATVRAAELLATAEPAASARAASVVAEAVDEVAAELGNTRAVARASYVHPAVPAAYEAGRLGDWWADGPTRSAGGLQPAERRLLGVLRRARRAGLGGPPSRSRRAA